ncbi:MAG: methyltransferase domain-containing protein [Pseudomonadota bacterium]
MSSNPDPAPTGVDWEARFRADDAPWERAGLHPAFQAWAEAGVLSDGARIFIPGCGRGAEVVEAARLGLDVAALDLSGTAIAWQGEHLDQAGLKAELVVGDGLAWRPTEPFDLVYEQTFLCAIQPGQRGDYEAMAQAVLRPGGKLLALFMQKQERGGPPYGCDLDAMRALFAPTRWSWPDVEPRAFPHPGLDDLAELAIVLTRR